MARAKSHEQGRTKSKPAAIDEIARGIESGGISSFGGLLILALWLLGTFFANRRSGLIIVLVGALLAAGVTVLHMQGATGLVGRKIANTSGVFFWVWTLIALGATGIFSFLLSAYALWSMRRSNQGS